MSGSNEPAPGVETRNGADFEHCGIAVIDPWARDGASHRHSWSGARPLDRQPRAAKGFDRQRREYTPPMLHRRRYECPPLDSSACAPRREPAKSRV